jgi:hypothetical protein
MEKAKMLHYSNGLRKCGIIYNGILFSHKEEQNFVIHKLMDGTGDHHLK